MSFEFFYEVSIYVNENNRGKATAREIACGAYEYFKAYQESKANGKPCRIMMSLLEQLCEDVFSLGNGKANEFYDSIMGAILA